MTVTILESYELLSRQAADIIVRQAQKAVKENGLFSIALSGGDTPLRTYELLAQQPWIDLMPWNETHVFWGDERCVPQDDPRHNALIASEILLSHVPVPEVQIHPVMCTENPHETAVKYECLLKSLIKNPDHLFDLVLLGVGNDGHIASIFPGTSVVDERERWVTEVSVPGQAFKRITLTFTALEKTAMLLFLVSGSGKAHVMQKILSRNGKKEILPASMIKPVSGECIWLLDKPAAEKIIR